VEHLDNNEIDALLKVLANPADIKYAYTLDMQSLVDEFPQSGIFRALLATNGNQQHINHAAAYFDPSALYKVVNAPDSLSEVNASQIVKVEETRYTQTGNNEINNQRVETEHEQTYATTEELYDPFAEVINQDVIIPVAEPLVETVDDEDTKQDITFAETGEANNEHIVNENVIAEPVHDFRDSTEYFHQDIEDEIYDEIVSIEDISLEQLAVFGKAHQETDIVNDEQPIPTNDHFVLEQEANSTTPDVATVVVENTSTPVNQKQGVSKYYDDKLPYTFMWWLDKTRREHATAYQPYIYNGPGPQISTRSSVVKKNTADELQQQYVENIFNVSIVDELERKAPAIINDHPVERKEDKIIKRFIQAEPQITHPANIKLDNENKAKKSSEDADELVTETLARIYIEQMLYQKAILTYKKLMLKFPEKSLYFAGQIQQLEKKPN
jgi:hypothetical protein